MGEYEKNEAVIVLTNLATALQSVDADPDDLIHAFGLVEQHRSSVAALLAELLQQPTS